MLIWYINVRQFNEQCIVCYLICYNYTLKETRPFDLLLSSTPTVWNSLNCSGRGRNDEPLQLMFM